MLKQKIRNCSSNYTMNWDLFLERKQEIEGKAECVKLEERYLDCKRLRGNFVALKILIFVNATALIGSVTERTAHPVNVTNSTVWVLSILT